MHHQGHETTEVGDDHFRSTGVKLWATVMRVRKCVILSGRVSRNGDAAAAQRQRGGSMTATRRQRSGDALEELWKDCGRSCGRFRVTVAKAVTQTVTQSVIRNNRYTIILSFRHSVSALYLRLFVYTCQIL